MSTDGFTKETFLLKEKELKHEAEKSKLRHELLKHCLSNHTYVFLVIASLVIVGVIYTCRASVLTDISDFWKVILPVISTYVGFAIGDRRGNVDK